MVFSKSLKAISYTSLYFLYLLCFLALRYELFFFNLFQATYYEKVQLPDILSQQLRGFRRLAQADCVMCNMDINIIESNFFSCSLGCDEKDVFMIFNSGHVDYCVV